MVSIRSLALALDQRGTLYLTFFAALVFVTET